VAEAASLRPARPEDWPQIEALLVQSSLPLDGAQAHLQGFVVACSHAGVVGVAGVEVHDAVGLLRSVAVGRAVQGVGLGRRLVDAAMVQARARGVGEFYLLTTSAGPYFERLGFAECARGMAPAALQASAEFRGACPASATLMVLRSGERKA